MATISTPGIARAARACVSVMFPPPISPMCVVIGPQGLDCLPGDISRPTPDMPFPRAQGKQSRKGSARGAGNGGSRQAPTRSSQCSSLSELLLHARHALPCGLLRRAGAAPVGFQADCSVVGVTLQSAELPDPINHTSPHGCPLISRTRGLAGDVFAVDVADTLLRQAFITVRERRLTGHRGIAGVPVQFEIGGADGIECPDRFGAGRGVAIMLILKEQNDALPGSLGGRFEEFRVHGRAVGSRVVQAPEIEATHAIGVKDPGKLQAPFQHFVLLLESKVRAELVALPRAVLGRRRSRPVDFKQRARDIGHAQAIALQQPPRFLDLFRIEVHQVLVPHATQLDPIEPKLAGGNLERATEVLRDLIRDDRNPEGRVHTVYPSFSSRYFLLMIAASFGVLALSGTRSSSTTAQPRKPTLWSAWNTPGRST